MNWLLDPTTSQNIDFKLIATNDYNYLFLNLLKKW
jgi:hypothetical protein